MAAVDYQKMMLESLRPEPAPEGMTSREIVRRAIEFDGPPRIPYNFVLHPNRSDIMIFALQDISTFVPGGGEIGSTYVDRWGVTWEVSGRAWDHAIGHPLSDLSKVDDYHPPDLVGGVEPSPMVSLLQAAHQAGKYIYGANSIMMFETMRSLVGFEELMMAPYLQPDGLHKLLEMLTNETIKLVKAYAQTGMVDAFMTWEDWGLQTSLQMRIETFREFYKPYYKRIIDACHGHGLHFIWHNCGDIADMFSDMVELGVDVLQLDQPRLMGHRALIDALGGNLCMWNTVDIQWSAEDERTTEELRQEVVDMVRIYDPARYGGGFIAKHYTQPWDIELSQERQIAISDAFFENGCRL